MNFVDVSNFANGKSFVELPFYKNGKVLENLCVWGMTLRSAGSMRFRWNEENPLRKETLLKIAGEKRIAQVQLDHTKIVYNIENENELLEKIGDGIITKNKNLMPVITVADCMPIYFFDSETGFFGVVHSGWKGTGIAQEAILLAEKNYGAKAKNISVALGPHIRNCCYIVNKERAEYFSRNFTQECVVPVKDGEELCKGVAGAAAQWNNGNGPLFRLSLEKANLAVLERSGILEENIVIAKDCTCCNNLFGSNRRETSLGKTFTVQAAFVINNE